MPFLILGTEKVKIWYFCTYQINLVTQTHYFCHFYL